MKLVCENPECERYGKEEVYVDVRYRMVDGKLQATCAPCPICGKIRREINPNEKVSPVDKNVALGKYSNASPEQKREILKKRSHDHYLKEVQPYKEHKLREAVSAFKEASKN